MSLEQLKETVSKLNSLLEDDQQGHMTWHMLLGERLNELKKLCGFKTEEELYSDLYEELKKLINETDNLMGYNESSPLYQFHKGSKYAFDLLRDSFKKRIKR